MVVHLVTYAQTESSFFPIGNSPIIYSVNYSQIKQKYLLSAGVSHYTAYQFSS